VCNEGNRVDHLVNVVENLILTLTGLNYDRNV
jgi:hypothetical protein